MEVVKSKSLCFKKTYVLRAERAMESTSQGLSQQKDSQYCSIIQIGKTPLKSSSPTTTTKKKQKIGK